MSNINEIQTILTDMLHAIHKVCEKNDIDYYMVCGTMLGAVRHNGFIPWDDDVDIAMFRDDYERFIKIANEKLPSHLKLRHSDIEEGYTFLYAKVDNKMTTLIEKGRSDYGSYGGIFVDIFPLDYVPDSYIKFNILFQVIKKVRRYLNYHYETLDFKERKLISLLKVIIKNITSKRILNKILKYLTTLYNDKNTSYVTNYYGSKNEMMHKNIIGEPKQYTFDDNQFYGIESYDVYLKTVYGDYMQLPVLEDRVSGHNITYISLTEPYN